MPILDSSTGKATQKYSVKELIKLASEMRAWNLMSLNCSGSGHSGGTLGVMDIAASLYLQVLNHDPRNPNWEDRDRVIWSAGHKAPAIYVTLAFCGYYHKNETLKLRKLYAGFDGHPNRFEVKGIESSTGSLGQGISLAVGSAINAKANKKKYKVFCIMSDGEQQEGSVWEAVLEAAHHKLDNLIGIIDDNRLQIDGHTKDIMNVQPLDKKYQAFGWHVIKCDGHDIKKIISSLEQAIKIKEKPIVVICSTIKGKGVSFMEDQVEWHGKPPNREELEKALKELNEEIDIEKCLNYIKKYQDEIDIKMAEIMPKFSQEYWWNSRNIMKVDMVPTRKGFGKCLEENGDDPRIFCLGADISDSITISEFYKEHPNRDNRWYSMGICEGSATAVAAGIAKEGNIAIFGTYGVFAANRNLDQLRISVCYNNYNVKIAGAHGGISVGPDGATHQALEEYFQICGLPNMHVVSGTDSIETRRLTKTCIFDIDGPCYIRFAREATPVVTDENTPCEFGQANIIIFKEEKENFKDAFITKIANKFSGKHDIAIISNGPEVTESMKALWILDKEFAIKGRVINMHTMKPMDKEALIRAAKECKAILTVEEHQKGGLGNKVAAAILEANLGKSITFDMIGVEDRFGESGKPWELIKVFGLTGEHIAKKAKEMLKN